MNRVYYYTKKMTSAVPTQDVVKYVESEEEIINLIKVGDYVNGHKVTSISPLTENIYTDDINIYFKKSEDIKSIVTKEQFESIKYEVE